MTRVIIKETAPGDWIATGVEFVYDGKAYIVKCKKEVILSAGFAFLVLFFTFHIDDVTAARSRIHKSSNFLE